MAKKGKGRGGQPPTPSMPAAMKRLSKNPSVGSREGVGAPAKKKT